MWWHTWWRATKLYAKDMGPVYGGLSAVSFLFAIFDIDPLPPRWFLLLLALVFIVVRGISLYTAVFRFRATSITLGAPTPIIEKDDDKNDITTGYSVDCAIDIEIENKQPSDLLLDYELKIVETDLPPSSIRTDEVIFRHKKSRRKRESGDSIPMMVNADEKIADGALLTKLDIVIDPIEEMMPDLGKAKTLKVEVIARELPVARATKGVAISSIVDGQEAVAVLLKRLEEILTRAAMSQQPTRKDSMDWLKLLMKGRGDRN